LHWTLPVNNSFMLIFLDTGYLIFYTKETVKQCRVKIFRKNYLITTSLR
jgi:hypothetical protein